MKGLPLHVGGKERGPGIAGRELTAVSVSVHPVQIGFFFRICFVPTSRTKSSKHWKEKSMGVAEMTFYESNWRISHSLNEYVFRFRAHSAN